MTLKGEWSPTDHLTDWSIPVPLVLDAVDGLLYHLSNIPGERRVEELVSHLLAGLQFPVQELDKFFPFDLVRLVLIHEEPGKPGDRIGIFARLVHQRNTVVCRHRFGSTCCCGRGRGDGGLHEASGSVFEEGVGQLVLESIGKFHVPYGLGSGLDLSGHALVPFTTQTHRPIYRGSLADVLGPFRAHGAEVVGKNIGCAAAV